MEILFTLQEIDRYLEILGEIPTKYGFHIVKAIHTDIIKKKQVMLAEQEKEAELKSTTEK